MSVALEPRTPTIRGDYEAANLATLPPEEMPPGIDRSLQKRVDQARAFHLACDLTAATGSKLWPHEVLPHVIKRIGNLDPFQAMVLYQANENHKAFADPAQKIAVITHIYERNLRLHRDLKLTACIQSVAELLNHGLVGDYLAAGLVPLLTDGTLSSEDPAHPLMDKVKLDHLLDKNRTDKQSPLKQALMGVFKLLIAADPENALLFAQEHLYTLEMLDLLIPCGEMIAPAGPKYALEFFQQAKWFIKGLIKKNDDEKEGFEKLWSIKQLEEMELTLIRALIKTHTSLKFADTYAQDVIKHINNRSYAHISLNEGKDARKQDKLMKNELLRDVAIATVTTDPHRAFELIAKTSDRYRGRPALTAECIAKSALINPREALRNIHLLHNEDAETLDFVYGSIAEAAATSDTELTTETLRLIKAKDVEMLRWGRSVALIATQNPELAQHMLNERMTEKTGLPLPLHIQIKIHLEIGLASVHSQPEKAVSCFRQVIEMCATIPRSDFKSLHDSLRNTPFSFKSDTWGSRSQFKVEMLTAIIKGAPHHVYAEMEEQIMSLLSATIEAQGKEYEMQRLLSHVALAAISRAAETPLLSFSALRDVLNNTFPNNEEAQIEILLDVAEA